MSAGRQGLRAIAAHLGPATRPALNRRGFAAARIIADWATIVGEAMAKTSLPERILRDTKTDTATLIIKVSPGIAVELLHQEPLVIERINSHFGFKAVTKLRLIQGKVAIAETQRKRKDVSPAPASAFLEARLAKVGDDDLRRALSDLGRAIRTPRD